MSTKSVSKVESKCDCKHVIKTTEVDEGTLVHSSSSCHYNPMLLGPNRETGEKAVAMDLTDDEKKKDDGFELCVLKSPATLTSSVGLLNGKSILSGLMGNSKRIFRLRMTRAATLTTGGGGTMNLATPVYPSQFDQYTQISSLFQYARLRKLSIEYQNLISPSNSTALPAWMAIGFQYQSAGHVSPTFAGTIRLPNSRTLTSCQTNWPVRLNIDLPKAMPWSLIDGTATGGDPVGGTPGQFWHTINGAVSATTAYFAYLIVAEYEFCLQQ